MAITQLFETTVADQTLGMSFRFLTIPRRSLDGSLQNSDEERRSALAEALDVDTQQLQQLSPSDLPGALRVMLSADDPTNVGAVVVASHHTRDDLDVFAEQLAYSNLIPFEESPINLISLASKAAGLAKNPTALGVFIGVVAGGASALLLVTVPTGIIVCATAVAFAKVVDARRDEIMSKLLGVQSKTKKGKVSAAMEAAARAEREAKTGSPLPPARDDSWGKES